MTKETTKEGHNSASTTGIENSMASNASEQEDPANDKTDNDAEEPKAADPSDLRLSGLIGSTKAKGSGISPTDSFDDRFHMIGSPDSAEDAIEVYFPGDEHPSGSDPVPKEIMDLYFPDSVDKTDPEVIENLTQGFLAEFLPQLKRSKTTLSEVTENQKILIETIQQENAKFTECEALDQVAALMEKAKMYHGKLVNIKKDMMIIREKTSKMKKTAVKLQQQKQREALQRELDKDRELEKERQLIAKPAKKDR